MTYAFLVTERAEVQLTAACEWWERSRPGARPFLDLFLDAVERIALAPLAPPVYRRRESVEIRRVLIRGTDHHCYYFVDDTVIVVAGVWSGRRRRGPPLTDLG